MRVPGLKRLHRSARWLRSRFVEHSLIIGYHRVASVTRDPFSMCVSPQHFAEQLEVLRKQASPIDLLQLVEGLGKNRLPERGVVITFDDGYADTLYEAQPLLEQYQIPATILITTGYCGREFWWDELDRLLVSASNLPTQLPVVMHDWVEPWDGTDTPTSRQRILWSLYKRLLLLSVDEREKLMDQLRSKLGDKPARSYNPRALTRLELGELAASALITMGAHTVTHPVLPALSVAGQRTEILQSKYYLEKVLGQPVTCFSYPNGSASKETELMVRNSGFHCACTSYNDVIWRGANRYQLPRFWVPDWDGAKFSGWLQRWLN